MINSLEKSPELDSLRKDWIRANSSGKLTRMKISGYLILLVESALTVGHYLHATNSAYLSNPLWNLTRAGTIILAILGVFAAIVLTLTSIAILSSDVILKKLGEDHDWIPSYFKYAKSTVSLYHRSFFKSLLKLVSYTVLASVYLSVFLDGWVFTGIIFLLSSISLAWLYYALKKNTIKVLKLLPNEAFAPGYVPPEKPVDHEAKQITAVVR